MTDPTSRPSRKYRNLFTPEEDLMLMRLVAVYGTQAWQFVASQLPGRTPRQCRERYKTYLSPDVDISPWSCAEDRLLVQKVQEYGCKWAEIRQFFGNRTVNNIKNRWNTVIRRLKSRPATSSFEEDFVRCAQFRDTGHYSMAVETEPEICPDPDPAAFFRVENLLN